MKKRIEVEEADNGYTVTVWNHEDEEEDKDDKTSDYMYKEPKKLVATTDEEVSAIFKKYLTKGK